MDSINTLSLIRQCFVATDCAASGASDQAAPGLDFTGHPPFVLACQGNDETVQAVQFSRVECLEVTNSVLRILLKNFHCIVVKIRPR